MDFKKLIDDNMELIKIGLLTVVMQFVTSLFTGFVIGMGLIILPLFGIVFFALAFIIDILACPVAYFLALRISSTSIPFNFVKILVSSIICYLVSSLLSFVMPGLSTVFGLLYPFAAVLLTNKELIKK